MIERKKFKRAVVKGTACICFAVLAFTFAMQSALAQSITVTTDKSSYNRGDQVTISGAISPPSGGVYVGVEVRGPGGSTVWIDMVQTYPSGNYVSPFRLDPSAPYGVYTVYASPETSNTTSWCEFTIPESAVTETRTIVVRGRTETVTTLVTTTIPESTVTESVYTFTIGTTETKISHQTVSVTASVTLTKTQTTRETTSTILTGTETATAATTIGEPIWHRIQTGLLLLIPFLVVGLVLGLLISKILRKRRKEKRTIIEDARRLEGTRRMEK